MAFTEDTKRLLRENLRGAYVKIATVAGAAIAWVAPYKAADYAGVQSRLHKCEIVFAFYFVIFLGTLILFMYRSLHQAYRLIGPSIPTQKALADIAATFVGVEKQDLVDECRINEDGSSDATSDVTLMAHSNHITQVEHVTSTPNAPTPVGARKELEIGAEGRQEGGVKIEPIMVRQTATQCVWNINFTPGLRKGHSVAYRYRTTTLPGSFAGTMEETRRRKLDSEHYSHQISYPTAHIRLKVSFAQKITPASISYDVWLGKGGVRHMDEYIRVSQSNCFRTGMDRDNIVYGELDVPYPIYGLRYVVTWKPK